MKNKRFEIEIWSKSFLCAILLIAFVYAFLSLASLAVPEFSKPTFLPKTKSNEVAPWGQYFKNFQQRLGSKSLTANSDSQNLSHPYNPNLDNPEFCMNQTTQRNQFMPRLLQLPVEDDSGFLLFPDEFYGNFAFMDESHSKQILESSSLSATRLTGQLSDSAYAKTSATFQTAYAQATTFARIIQSNALLFRSEDTSNTAVSNVFFTLTESFFVEILSEVNANVLRVKYDDFVGFAERSAFETVNFTPTQPHEERTFDISGEYDVRLRTYASSTSASKRLLPAGTKNLRYVASVQGEKPASGSSNVWYFCVYEEAEDWVLTGYIYSDLAQNLTAYTKNTEGKLESTTADVAVNTQAIEEGEKILEMSPGIKWILITLLTLPTLLVFLLLIRKPKHGKGAEKMSPRPAEYAEEIAVDETAHSKSAKISAKRQPKKFTSGDKYFCKINENPSKYDEKSLKNDKKSKNGSDFMSKFFTTKLPTYPDDDDLL